MARITKEPGNPYSDTPAWICIGNSRVDEIDDAERKMMIDYGYITLSQVMEMSGYSDNWIRYRIWEKVIPAIKVERVWWIQRSTMEQIIIKERNHDLPVRKAVSKPKGGV